MVAIVYSNESGKIRAMVRRNFRLETVQGNHPTLKTGDRIEVVRQTNNPFLIFKGIAVVR